ncbi:hypothetical protein C7271_13805 [filamentous cyanobacterium CCP5]|nr:hypothetical protein C7271_13805 [filamentous cyanobacterium CCP5]
MQFDRDLFISYAHIDNRALEDDQEGWISLLHKGLEIRLSQLRGEKPDIWRDLKLQGNDDFSDTILDQFPKLALLVSILSPRYVKSKWCLRELQHFCQAAESRGGIRVGDNKARIFKVIKTYLPRDSHPQELERLLGYEFYEFDSSGRPREFSEVLGPEFKRKFWAKLEDLAYDIHQTLELLEALPEAGETRIELSEAAANGKTIYLAETTYDLNSSRDQIRRELELAGHRVLPANALPMTPDFGDLVRQNLAQSDLTVHLIAPQKQMAEADDSPSAVALQQLFAARTQEQIEIASVCCKERVIPRILWMPPTAQMGEADGFIQSLQSEPDFLSTKLEDLKTLIQDRLTRPAQPEIILPANGATQIYLDCDQRDLDSPEIEPLYEWLEQHFQVQLPMYEGSGVAQSEALIRQCQAVLIFYGQASGLWLKRRLLALKKTLYGRPTPLLAKAVYVAGPENPNKLSFSDPDVPVIRGFNEFQPTLLDGFLSQLGQGG